MNLERTETLEPEYSVIPAIPKAEGGKIPAARTKHAACAFNICVAIYGGNDETGQTLDEGATIWLFNTADQAWETLGDKLEGSALTPKPRHSARLFDHQNNLILYGGTGADGTPLTDVWHFDYVNKTWTQLPDAPVSTRNAALSEGVLHLISSNDTMSSSLHILQLNAKSEEGQGWQTVPYPTNPLTPGPLPRIEAGLVPVSTGYGRQYLLYMLGAQPANPESTSESAKATDQGKDAPASFWSDIWTYQLPSSEPEVKLTTQIYEAMKPARIKDSIRGALGVDSGKHSWSEIEVLPPADLIPEAGKVHPGPRSSLGFDVMKNKSTVVVWGGLNPKGEREGDGWIIKLE